MCIYIERENNKVNRAKYRKSLYYSYTFPQLWNYIKIKDYQKKYLNKENQKKAYNNFCFSYILNVYDINIWYITYISRYIWKAETVYIYTQLYIYLYIYIFIFHTPLKFHNSKAMLNDQVSQRHHQNAPPWFVPSYSPGMASSSPTGQLIADGWPSSLHTEPSRLTATCARGPWNSRAGALQPLGAAVGLTAAAPPGCWRTRNRLSDLLLPLRSWNLPRQGSPWIVVSPTAKRELPYSVGWSITSPCRIPQEGIKTYILNSFPIHFSVTACNAFKKYVIKSLCTYSWVSAFECSFYLWNKFLCSLKNCDRKWCFEIQVALCLKHVIKLMS